MNKDVFAVAVMTENMDSGMMDLKHRVFDANSREEATGLGIEYYQGPGIVIHRISAIRVIHGTEGSLQPYINELHNGRKIAAIKLYREDTGVGLKEAKAFIDELEMKHGGRR
jgi:hypothetical protein